MKIVRGDSHERPLGIIDVRSKSSDKNAMNIADLASKVSWMIYRIGQGDKEDTEHLFSISRNLIDKHILQVESERKKLFRKLDVVKNESEKDSVMMGLFAMAELFHTVSLCVIV